MMVMNQIEKTLSEERGEAWVKQAKRQALRYQESVRLESLKGKVGSRYLTQSGTIVILKEVTPEGVLAKYPSGSQRMVAWSTFNTWIALNPASMNQLSATQQLAVQIQVLQEQKRRVNLQHRLPEDKRLILKGLDLAIQSLQNLQNPNNQW